MIPLHIQVLVVRGEAMIISKIAVNQSQTSGGTTGIDEPPEKRVNADNKAFLPKEGITGDGKSKSDLSLDSGSREVKTELSGLARNIRSEGKTLKKVNEFVERMKERLGEIVKNYPPFPPDNPERMEMLKSFTALRKEIERMTFPPEEKHLPELPVVTQKSTNEELSGTIKILDNSAGAINDSLESLGLTAREIASSIQADTAEEKVLKMSAEIKDMLLTETTSLSGDQRIDGLRQLLD